MKKKIIIIAALVLVLLVIAAAVVYCYAVAGFKGTSWVYIHSGADDDEVKAAMAEALGVTGERAATLWSLLGGDAGKAHGAYMIKPGTSAARVYRMISTGVQTPVKLTFNNLRTMSQLAARVGQELETDSTAFIAACDSLLPVKGFRPAEYPAAFLPDTYEFYWTASPEKVVATLSFYRDRFWNDTRRGKAKALGLTPVQVATIASIAEEETNDGAERGTVGRLYINRLKRGMKLQADPTVKFATGDFGLRRITGTHLAVQSPYNTYQVAGLPPGPIRIPDAATIDAVLDSKPHDYLYMCAKDDFSGRHNFASDYATHQKNASKYHKALDNRNIAK